MEIIKYASSRGFARDASVVNTSGENDKERLRQERGDLNARCIALTMEQRKTLQGFIGREAEESPEEMTAARCRTLRKCALLQAEFLRLAGELRNVGQRLHSQLAGR